MGQFLSIYTFFLRSLHLSIAHVVRQVPVRSAAHQQYQVLLEQRDRMLHNIHHRPIRTSSHNSND